VRAEISRSRRDIIGDRLRHSAARKQKKKTALVFGERSRTYAKLDATANCFANALLQKKLQKGDRVAAYGRNADAHIIAWLACALAGLHVPINHALTGKELLYILSQAGSKAFFYDPSLADEAEKVNEPSGSGTHSTLYGGEDFNLLDEALNEPGNGLEREDQLDEDDVVQLLCSSGTTAARKGAWLPDWALMAEGIRCITDLEYRPEDRAIVAPPLSLGPYARLSYAAAPRGRGQLHRPRAEPRGVLQDN
jgi:fatty-acyl-CoA synthase